MAAAISFILAVPSLGREHLTDEQCRDTQGTERDQRDDDERRYVAAAEGDGLADAGEMDPGHVSSCLGGSIDPRGGRAVRGRPMGA